MQQAAELMFNSIFEGKIRAKEFNLFGKIFLKSADHAPNPQTKKNREISGF